MRRDQKTPPVNLWNSRQWHSLVPLCPWYDVRSLQDGQEHCGGTALGSIRTPLPRAPQAVVPEVCVWRCSLWLGRLLSFGNQDNFVPAAKLPQPQHLSSKGLGYHCGVWLFGGGWNYSLQARLMQHTSALSSNVFTFYNLTSLYLVLAYSGPDSFVSQQSMWSW